MDIKQVEMINLVERAALQLPRIWAATAAAKGPKIYSSYIDAAQMAGWRSNCQRSSLRPLLNRAMDADAAKAAGFKKTRNPNLRQYILVPTSFDRGFKGRASKTYYSVWGK